MKKFTSIDEVSAVTLQDSFKPQITVLGIGGAGTNAVNNMINLELSGVKFAVINTDVQSLDSSLSPIKVQIGPKITRGLGAGSKPEMGISAAEESIDQIKDLLKDTNLLFLTAGMGGGTGTGASQVVAKIAKEMGILTIAFVTKPFLFEGAQKMSIADAGVKELENYVDSLVVVSNQNLFEVINERTSFLDAFKVTDNVLYLGVKSITDLIVSYGLVNLDFNDIKSVMEGMGRTMIGSAQGEGEQRALDVVQAAVVNPLLENPSIKGAKKLLVNITGGNDLTLHEINDIISYIKDELDSNAFINFGTIYSENLNGRIMLSIVATGLLIENTNNQEQSQYKRHTNSVKPKPINAEAKSTFTRVATERNISRPTERSLERNAERKPTEKDLHASNVNNTYNPRRLEEEEDEADYLQTENNFSSANNPQVEQRERNTGNDIFSSIIESNFVEEDEVFNDNQNTKTSNTKQNQTETKNKEGSIFDIPSFLKKR